MDAAIVTAGQPRRRNSVVLAESLRDAVARVKGSSSDWSWDLDTREREDVLTAIATLRRTSLNPFKLADVGGASPTGLGPARGLQRSCSLPGGFAWSGSSWTCFHATPYHEGSGTRCTSPCYKDSSECSEDKRFTSRSSALSTECGDSSASMMSPLASPLASPSSSICSTSRQLRSSPLPSPPGPATGQATRAQVRVVGEPAPREPPDPADAGSIAHGTSHYTRFPFPVASKPEAPEVPLISPSLELNALQGVLAEVVAEVGAATPREAPAEQDVSMVFSEFLSPQRLEDSLVISEADLTLFSARLSARQDAGADGLTPRVGSEFCVPGPAPRGPTPSRASTSSRRSFASSEDSITPSPPRPELRCQASARNDLGEPPPLLTVRTWSEQILRRDLGATQFDAMMSSQRRSLPSPRGCSGEVRLARSESLPGGAFPTSASLKRLSLRSLGKLAHVPEAVERLGAQLEARRVDEESDEVVRRRRLLAAINSGTQLEATLNAVAGYAATGGLMRENCLEEIDNALSAFQLFQTAHACLQESQQ